MTRSAAPGNSRVVFNRRAYNIKRSFPQNEKKLESFRSQIAGLEHAGRALSDRKAIHRELNRMKTLSFRMMGDLRDAVRAEPELKLPPKVLGMLFFINLNSRLLLSRLGRVQANSGILLIQEDVEVESILDEVRKSGSFPGRKS